MAEPGLEHLIILLPPANSGITGMCPVDYHIKRQMFTGYVDSEDRLPVRARTEGAVLRHMWVETGQDGGHL